ncbi:craniofacial development protein 2-like [Condylostylus longicornis]|uniref:craniofacial development protein 2-like n=1 Tax=Condylostylus longicornis TaxID=2530218 RepID=UPI00244E4D4E|nr:craniofacial development protein 2-like [Condylostylus longicornis]
MRPQNEPRIIRTNSRNRPRQSTRNKDLNNDLKIFSWNVRTLYQPDVTAIQEMRWTGNGILKKRECDIYYSYDERKHELGTGFVLMNRARHLVIDFKEENPRMCCLRLKGKFFNTSIINVHAQTEDKSDEEKEEFYEELEKIYDNCPKNDIKIIIGDCNAKIGHKNTYNNQIGQFSMHEQTNDNGKRLIFFAASKNMLIASTMFKHKRIHIVTWKSPDSNTFNQIDHYLIDARHKSSALDVRAFRGANIDSDHYMIRLKLRARISNAKKATSVRQEKFNTNRLKEEEYAKNYERDVSNNLERWNLSNETNVEEEWNAIKSSIKTAASNILGIKPRERKNEWFDNECEEATNQKN